MPRPALTTESFIEKARSIHGDRYDYSNVQYVNSYTKVEIGCPLHGIFTTRPSDHTSPTPNGCKQCALVSRTKTTEEFIREMTEKRPDFDYSHVKYTGSKRKVTIVCPQNHVFQMTPNALLTGTGCPRCASPGRYKTHEEALLEAIAVHGDKYIYTSSIFTGVSKPFTIICPHHGEWTTIFEKHVYSKQGCAKCAGIARKTTDDFIRDAIAVHGNQYDYSEVIYEGNKVDVTIKCGNGHIFTQSPNRHLCGEGCPSCRKKNEYRIKETLEEFIEADIIHDKKWHVYGNRRPDFRIKSMKLIIEYDGEQHFEQVSVWGEVDKTKRIDTWKAIMALRRGYSVIRIPYTIFKYKDWKETIRAFVKHYECKQYIFLTHDSLYDEHRQMFLTYKHSPELLVSNEI